MWERREKKGKKKVLTLFTKKHIHASNGTIHQTKQNKTNKTKIPKQNKTKQNKTKEPNQTICKIRKVTFPVGIPPYVNIHNVL